MNIDIEKYKFKWSLIEIDILTSSITYCSVDIFPLFEEYLGRILYDTNQLETVVVKCLDYQNCEHPEKLIAVQSVNDFNAIVAKLDEYFVYDLDYSCFTQLKSNVI